jgi:MFS family permease
MGIRGSMKRNKNLYMTYCLLKKAFPIWFVYLLFLLSKDLNYTQAILLDSFAAAMALVLEVPSGILADRFNRKTILIVGEVIITLNFCVLYFSDTYSAFITGALLSGVGEALVSGTGEALIYDTFVEQKEKDGYLEFNANINKWGFIVVAIVTLSASYMFDMWNSLPMLLTIIMQVGCLVCICNLKETRVIKKNECKKFSFRTELKIQKENIRKIFETKGLMEIFLLYVLMIEIISNINYSTQAYLPSLGLEIKYLGGIMFVFNLASALGAKVAKKVNANGRMWVTLYAVILFVLSLGNIYLTIVALICSRIINGFVWPVLSNETNKRIESSERATMLSYQNLFSSIMPLFIDPIIGIGFDNYGISKTYFIMGLMLVVMCAMWLWRARNNTSFN